MGCASSKHAAATAGGERSGPAPPKPEALPSTGPAASADAGPVAPLANPPVKEPHLDANAPAAQTRSSPDAAEESTATSQIASVPRVSAAAFTAQPAPIAAPPLTAPAGTIDAPPSAAPPSTTPAPASSDPSAPHTPDEPAPQPTSLATDADPIDASTPSAATLAAAELDPDEAARNDAVEVALSVLSKGEQRVARALNATEVVIASWLVPPHPEVTSGARRGTAHSVGLGSSDAASVASASRAAPPVVKVSEDILGVDALGSWLFPSVARKQQQQQQQQQHKHRDARSVASSRSSSLSAHSAVAGGAAAAATYSAVAPDSAAAQQLELGFMSRSPSSRSASSSTSVASSARDSSPPPTPRDGSSISNGNNHKVNSSGGRTAHAQPALVNPVGDDLRAMAAAVRSLVTKQQQQQQGSGSGTGGAAGDGAPGASVKLRNSAGEPLAEATRRHARELSYDDPIADGAYTFRQPQTL